MFMALSLSNIRCIFYPEVYPTLYSFIMNVLGENQYTVREEEYLAMQKSNRSLFFLKYFNDFRESKRNVLTTFSTISLSDITIEVPGDLFLPVPLPFTPCNLQGKAEMSSGNNILLTLGEIEMDFATSPSIFDMNLSTTAITCSLPCTEK